jgi:hypothetical protein
MFLRRCGLSLALAFVLTAPGFAQQATPEQNPQATPGIAWATLLAPVTPFKIDIDLRDLPRPREWQPGDPTFLVPKRSFLPPGMVEPLIDERRDPLVDRQISVAESWTPSVGSFEEPAAGGGGFTTPIYNFTGIAFNGAGVPDTVGDVGPNHIIEAINASRVQIWDKTMPTPTLLATFQMDQLGTGVCANGSGDPVVIYDRNADRWVLMEFLFSGTNLCVYVSQTADPVSGGWYAYNFVPPSFPDYPKIGVWPTDANGGGGSYVVTANAGVAVYAMERGPMLDGATAQFQIFDLPSLAGFAFQSATPADIDGPDLPPATAPAIVMRHRDTEVHNGPAAPADLLEMWALDVDWVSSSNSALTSIPSIDVAEFSSHLCGLTSFSCMDQPGTGVQLDPIREVIMHRLQYIHHAGEGFETVVGNFVVDVTGTEVGGIRWFELRRTGGAANPWTLHQEGTYSIDSDDRWMGGSSMDQSRNIALAFNISSSTTFPSIRYTGRQADDPLGVMTQPETTIAAGSSSNPGNRYGDYAAMGLDPSDDCTFWYIGEYNPSSQWSTRWGAFKFDSCGCQLAPLPPALGLDDSQFNEVTLNWPDSELDTVSKYEVLRSRIPGGPYESVATVPDSSPAVANGPGYLFTDIGVSGGIDYYYVVVADDGGACKSAKTNEQLARPQGSCLLEPLFGGLAAVGIDVDDTCGITVDWAPGAAECGPGVLYNLYRSTDPSFVPGPANLVASGLPGTSTLDQNGVVSGLEYFYVVRAVDVENLVEETNTVQGSVVAGGSNGMQTFFYEDFENPATFSNWTVTTGPGFHTCGEWMLGTDPARGPDLGFGQYAIANSYDCATLLPATSASLDSPVIDTSSPTLARVILDFDMLFDHFNGGDTATVEVWDGSQWVVLWTDANADFDAAQSFDVSAHALGNPNFQVRFNYQNGNGDRWFSVDNVRLGVDVVCSTAPEPAPAPSGAGATSPLLATRTPGGSAIDISWDAASCGSGVFNLLYGDLSGVSTYVLSGSACSIGNGSYIWTGAPAGSVWFLIVGGDGVATESSWGRSSVGERNGLDASGQCGATNKNIVATCD